MIPDGADPCAAYQQLERELANAERALAEAKRIQGDQFMRAERAESALSATSPSNGVRRLIYNKATRKIDVVRKSDGLVTDSFDPPEELG